MIGIIFNPNAAGGKSVPRMENFLKMLDSRNIEYEYRETTKAWDAFDFAEELSKTCDTIVVGGGDGTVFEVLCNVWDKDVRLALLPYGSGNDGAMCIYGKDFPDEKMIDVITGDSETRVDCARINDKYTSVLLASFGLGADILVAFKEKGGSYFKVIPGVMRHTNRRNFTIKTDDKEEVTYFSEFVSVFNFGSAGGGIKVLDSSVSDDGQMEIIVLEKSSVLRRYQNFIALAKKRVEKQPNVKVLRFKECTITCEKEEPCNLDGELIFFNEINIKVLPKQLRFVVPKQE